MNDWLGIPTASRKHSQAEVIEEALVTGIQEDLCLWKVRWKAAGKGK